MVSLTPDDGAFQTLVDSENGFGFDRASENLEAAH